MDRLDYALSESLCEESLVFLISGPITFFYIIINDIYYFWLQFTAKIVPNLYIHLTLA